MELEEMKERWAALNDCLERTEMLQESVIRELVQTKGEKSVSQLINWKHSVLCDYIDHPLQHICLSSLRRAFCDVGSVYPCGDRC